MYRLLQARYTKEEFEKPSYKFFYRSNAPYYKYDYLYGNHFIGKV